MESRRYQFEHLQAPLPKAVCRELQELWGAVFEGGVTPLAGVMAGEEREDNSDTFYIARYGGRAVATSHLTVSRCDPRLAGLGEVATLPSHRELGLATELCRRAAEDFDREGGQALFLGTSNPVAARVYGRLGWRYLAGTKVMLRVGNTQSPEEFLVDYFREASQTAVTTRPGSARDRIRMIPLIVTPHDWRVLDANTGILSTRWSVQTSCVGLYPKYEATGHCGAWWAAGCENGPVAGLASAKLVDGETARVEAFCHHRHERRVLSPLFRQAAEWAALHGASVVLTTCECHDPIKRAALEGLGMQATHDSVRLPHTAGDLSLGVFRIPE